MNDIILSIKAYLPVPYYLHSSQCVKNLHFHPRKLLLYFDALNDHKIITPAISQKVYNVLHKYKHSIFLARNHGWVPFILPNHLSLFLTGMKQTKIWIRKANSNFFKLVNNKLFLTKFSRLSGCLREGHFRAKNVLLAFWLNSSVSNSNLQCWTLFHFHIHKLGMQAPKWND